MKDVSMAKAATPGFLSGGGEMGHRIRECDWAKTSLGPIDTWPKSLQTCIRIMLTSRQPIWIGWGKELIKFYNDPYRAIVGGKHPWALGQPASEVWKEIWTGIAPMLRQVMEEDTGTYVEEQLLIMERNGYPEETYFTFSYSPVPGDDGGTAGMICANTDETDKVLSRRQIETLTALGQELNTAQRNTEVFEKTLTILNKNPKDFPFAVLYLLEGDAARLYDTSPHPSGFPSFFNLQAQYLFFPEQLRQAARGLKPTVLSWDGATSPVLPQGPWAKASHLVMIMPVHQSGSQESIGFFVIGTNPHRLIEGKYQSFFDLISDQVSTTLSRARAYEEELKRLEALAEIDRAKTTFFSNISHEFRTPLTLLLGPIEDALNEPHDVEANTQRMEVAFRNALRMQKLVNMLLDFSRIEAGRMDAHVQAVDLGAFTEGLVSAFRSAVEKAGMTLIVDCSMTDPVHVDPDMWEKIVLNLVSNAFKYSTQGHIRVALTTQEDAVTLTVTDTGSGIPESELSKVFDRFYRVQNVQGRSQEGTGIGLAMVRELVKLHKGTIDVTSELGRGSTFRVTIPRDTRAAEGGKNAASPLPTLQSRTYLEDIAQWGEHKISPAPAEGAGKPLTEFKVLLADDNLDMRQHIERLLSRYYTVIEVSNGEEAFLQIKRHRPDLVLSDIMMPVLDGFGLLKKIRNDENIRSTPVIFLSARAGEEALVEGLNAGADDYLIKPFSSKELLAKISSQIKISKSHARNAQELEKKVIDRTKELQTQRDFAETIMNSSAELIFVFDLQFNILSLNKKVEELYGLKRTEVVGKPVAQYFADLGESDMNHITRALKGEVIHNPRFYSRKTNKHYESFLIPLRDEAGSVYAVLATAHDITEMIEAAVQIKTSAEQLQRANETLLSKNKELEQFAYISSHDLQEPLRKIQTFSELVARHINDEAYAVRYLEKIEASAARMSTLIKDILAYSKISNTATLPEQVDLNLVLENVKTDFELLINEKQARIEHGALPAVRGNKFQFHQLFSNLVSNALKFSEAHPVIRINSEVVSGNALPNHPAIDKGRSYHELVFQDNGIGFDAEYSEQIFGMFQRLQNRRDYSGTGIGLALCRKIVESHGGIINATSGKGQGATFTIFLPIA